MQTGNADCAAACLATCLGICGREVSIGYVKLATGLADRECSMMELMCAAESLGLCVRAVECEIADLCQMEEVAILHWREGHYVVKLPGRAKRLKVHDPARGCTTFAPSAAGVLFGGAAIVIESGGSPPGRRSSVVRQRTLWDAVQGSRRLLASIFVFGVAAQAGSVLIPVVIGRITNEIGARRVEDGSLGYVGAGIAMAVVFVASGICRSLLKLQLERRIGEQTTCAVWNGILRAGLRMHRVLRSGDVVERSMLVGVLNDTAVRIFTDGLIDGLAVLASLIAVVVLDWRLGLVILGICCARSLLFWFARPRIEASALDAARLQGRLYEGAVGLGSCALGLKVGGSARAAERDMLNRIATYWEAAVRQRVVGSVYGGAQQLLGLVAPVVLFVVGARSVESGQSTIGGIVTANAIALNAIAPLNGVLTIGERVRAILVQLDRVEELWDVLDAEVTECEPLDEGALELRNVCYRYRAWGEWTLDDISLALEGGRVYGLAGASGAGKSTLGRVITGREAPTRGVVSVGGRVCSDARALFEIASIVDHDPSFWGGTLADALEIDCGNPDCDNIVRSLVGELDLEDIWEGVLRRGMVDAAHAIAGLSLGERQRLGLLRAILRDPWILVLDEATSGLDRSTELRVMGILRRRRGITVVISHRGDLLAGLDELFVLSRGMISC